MGWMTSPHWLVKASLSQVCVPSSQSSGPVLGWYAGNHDCIETICPLMVKELEASLIVEIRKQHRRETTCFPHCAFTLNSLLLQESRTWRVTDTFPNADRPSPVRCWSPTPSAGLLRHTWGELEQGQPFAALALLFGVHYPAARERWEKHKGSTLRLWPSLQPCQVVLTSILMRLVIPLCWQFEKGVKLPGFGQPNSCSAGKPPGLQEVQKFFPEPIRSASWSLTTYFTTCLSSVGEGV